MSKTETHITIWPHSTAWKGVYKYQDKMENTDDISEKLYCIGRQNLLIAELLDLMCKELKLDLLVQGKDGPIITDR